MTCPHPCHLHTRAINSTSNKRYIQLQETNRKGIHVNIAKGSLISRPLSDFSHSHIEKFSPQLRDKNWEWPGNEAKPKVKLPIFFPLPTSTPVPDSIESTHYK